MYVSIQALIHLLNDPRYFGIPFLVQLVVTDDVRRDIVTGMYF